MAEEYFHLTQEDSKALIAANLNKTDWQIYMRLRLFENLENKPGEAEAIEACGYTKKTFYKSLKKLKKLNLSPTWTDSLLLITQEK
jgi:DNA-binding MarR family transcriptional regulator